MCLEYTLFAVLRSLGLALERKRQLLEPRLQAIGFKTVPTHGAYFIVADVSSFLRPGETDEMFATRLTVEAGVTTIPVSRLGSIDTFAFTQAHTRSPFVTLIYTCDGRGALNCLKSLSALLLTGQLNP